MKITQIFLLYYFKEIYKKIGNQYTQVLTKCFFPINLVKLKIVWLRKNKKVQNKRYKQFDLEMYFSYEQSKIVQKIFKLVSRLWPKSTCNSLKYKTVYLTPEFLRPTYFLPLVQNQLAKISFSQFCAAQRVRPCLRPRRRGSHGGAGLAVAIDFPCFGDDRFDFFLKKIANSNSSCLCMYI